MGFHAVDKIIMMSSWKWSSLCLPAIQSCYWPWKWGESRMCLRGNSAFRAGIGKMKNLSFSFPLHFQLALCNSSVAKQEEELVIPTHYSRNKASLTRFYLSHTPNVLKTISASAPPSCLCKCLWGCLLKQWLKQPSLKKCFKNKIKEWLSTKHLYPLHCFMELLE